MNTEFKGTKGKFETIYTRLSNFTLSTVISGKSVIAHINSENVSPEECKANGELFADAGNTIQSCGLLPSELLKQRDKLRKMLENIYQIENGAFGLQSFNIEDLKRKIKRVLESTEVKP